MTPDQTPTQTATPVRVNIRAATVDDVKHALAAGWRDMWVRPGLSLFFGAAYAMLGGGLLAGLIVYDQLWIVIAAGLGFPLVAPFFAAGLYEMSRRYGKDEPFSSADIFLIILRQQKREFGWIAFVVLFIFWMWAYQVRLYLALFLQNQATKSWDNFVNAIFTTTDGALFLLIGSMSGAVMATILFSTTVIAMPLLMDKNVDFVTAVINSVNAIRLSPTVMLGWGGRLLGR